MARLEQPQLPPAPVSHRAGIVSACGLLITLTVAVNQSAVHWRQNVVDSHLFAYHGWTVAQGARPYLDVWDNKPPGIWWLNAAGFALFGEGITGELAICTIALAAALAAFTGIARLVYQRSLALPATLTGCILLTHLLYEGGANRTETFVVACECLAVFGYLLWLRQRRHLWLFLAGLLAGAAPWFKQSGLAGAGAIAAHLLWQQLQLMRRGEALRLPTLLAPLLVAAAGFMVVPLVAGARLAADGALGEFWYAVGPFNRAYFAIGDATYTRLDRVLPVYWNVLVPLRWLFAAMAIGLAWALWGRFRPGRRAADEQPRTYVELLWLWFLFAAYLACVGPGRQGHHFLPVLPPLGLLTLYPLHRLAGPRGLAAALVARPTTAGALVLYLAALAALLATNLTELGRCWQQKPHPWSLTYAETPGYMVQADTIRQLTKPDDLIYVWGWSPGTYRYAYRPCPSRYATFEKVGQLGQHARFILDAAVADLRRRPPEVFVISDNDLHGVVTPPRTDFGDWLAGNYTDQGLIGGMHILTRNRP